MKTEHRIIVLQETVAESIAKDVVTFSALLGCTLLGWWVGSAALQWIGGLCWLLFTCGKAMAVALRNYPNAKTPQECADWLAREYGVRAGDEGDAP